MKPPPFLKVLPADVGSVGALGACVLALVRYVTSLPGETNGRRMVDGEMWWRASAPDMAEALGNGISARTVSGTVKQLTNTGALMAIPTQDFYGDRAKAYRASDMPSAISDAGSDLPSADIADRSADIAEHVGRNRHTTSADIADLPIPGELEEELSEGKNARTRGARLRHDWMPTQNVIDAMKAECPHVDLQAEHTKFVDYWTDKAGKEATKVSWDGTWRNWIRRAAESQHRSGSGRNGRSTADLRVEQTQALKRQPSLLELE